MPQRCLNPSMINMPSAKPLSSQSLLKSKPIPDTNTFHIPVLLPTLRKPIFIPRIKETPCELMNKSNGSSKKRS